LEKFWKNPKKKSEEKFWKNPKKKSEEKFWKNPKKKSEEKFCKKNYDKILRKNLPQFRNKSAEKIKDHRLLPSTIEQISSQQTPHTHSFDQESEP
jgi:C-terminal processing protease CtpA/Prc